MLSKVKAGRTTHVDAVAWSQQLLERTGAALRTTTRGTLTGSPSTRAQYRMMGAVAEDLASMAVSLMRAAERCRAMQEEPTIREDPNVLRDAKHLRARVEGMARQLEDTLQTLERMMGQPRRLPASHRDEQPADGAIRSAARPRPLPVSAV